MSEVMRERVPEGRCDDREGSVSPGPVLRSDGRLAWADLRLQTGV